MIKKRPRYYSWKEGPVLMDAVMAGQLLGMSPECIGKLCRAGELPAAKIGKGWVIRKDDVMRLVGAEADA